MASVTNPKILTLPNELLLNILLAACKEPDSVREHGPRLESPDVPDLSSVREINQFAVIIISKVCRRFRQIISPEAYRLVEVGTDQDQETKLLHRTLQENPSLRKYCTCLYFFWDDPDHPDEQAEKLSIYSHRFI